MGSTASTSGGTAASNRPGSSRAARRQVNGCTRPGTPPGSASSTTRTGT
jgi:hypothetical protein